MPPRRGTRNSNSRREQKRKVEESENESSEEEVESEPEVKYNVEKIIDKRSVRKGNRRVYQYLVKWEGYPSSTNTWEPTSNLKSCAELLKDFNTRYDKEKSLKLSRKSLERLSRSPTPKRKRGSSSPKRKQDSVSPKRNKKQKVESEQEEEEEEDNDSSDYEVAKKTTSPRKPTPKKKVGRKKKSTYTVRSPRRPRTPTRKPSPRRTRASNSKVFQDDNIVVEDPHFSSHQSEDDKKRIRQYLEKLKEISKSATIKLLTPSQLLAAQSLTSKLTLKITHNLTQSLSLVEEEQEEEEEDEKKREDDKDDNNDDDNVQKDTELHDEGIPLPVDEDDQQRLDADEKTINDLIAEHDYSESMSFD